MLLYGNLIFLTKKKSEFPVICACHKSLFQEQVKFGLHAGSHVPQTPHPQDTLIHKTLKPNVNVSIVTDYTLRTNEDFITCPKYHVVKSSLAFLNILTLSRAHTTRS